MDVELLSYKNFLVDYCGVSEENAVEVCKKINDTKTREFVKTLLPHGDT